MKERLGLTEMRKQANRMNFGEVRNHFLIILNKNEQMETSINWQ